MTQRTLAVLGTCLAMASVTPTAAGQTASGAATGVGGLLATVDGLPVPMTPWGDPDLQGVWNNSTSTPIEERTEEERAQGRQAQAAVIEATSGTGAGWIERAGDLDRDSLIIDPPNGRIPRLRPAAIRRLVERENARAGRGEADSWLDRNSWERCISRTMPVAMIPNAYNANYQILQTPEYVVVQMEMIHESRIIPLDGRPHVPDGIGQWLGNSRGHWEGDTLVVETRGFHDRIDGGEYQPSHVIQTGHRGPGGTLSLVERFRIVDVNRIDYHVTIADPNTFTRSYTLSIPMTRRDTSDPLNHLFEYACHEGNHAMPNLLSAGRTDEQQALAAAARVSQQRRDAGHPGVREPAVPFVP